MHLYKFELIKILRNKKTLIVLAVLFVYLLMTLISRINSVTYVNENGSSEKGFTAISKLKKEKEKWTGALTEDKIGEVITYNKQINNNEEYFSHGGLTDEGYYYIQGIEDIRGLVSRSFGGFQNYDYYEIDGLQPESSQDFYSNRKNALTDWLGSTAQYNYSEKEKQYFMSAFDKFSVPLHYSYSDGWKQLIDFSSAISYGIALCICILVASVFSREYEVNAAPVFYTSYHGRGKGVRSKLTAAFIIMNGIYFVVNLLFILIIFFIYGTQGGGDKIQSNFNYWFSIYNFNNIQAVIMVLLLSYIGCFGFTFFVLWMSSRFKNSNAAIIISFILIFGSGMLGQFSNNNKWIQKIMGLLPDKLLSGNILLSEYTLYNIGPITVPPFILLPILYILISLIFIGLIIRSERDT